MGLFDPTLSKASRLGLTLAGSLIGEVQRRGTRGSHRTPDHLLVEDAAGMPGPALVGPLPGHDMLLPGEVDRAQAKELAVAAGKVALAGFGRRLLGVARTLLGRDQAGNDEVDPTSPTASAERAAWDRFVLALEKLTEMQAAYALYPDEAGAEHLRRAEVELEDAVAVAGEFEVKKIRWLLT